ncbi:GNAT family N-acetyltransferase [Aquirhabdus sp.]|uniref:GNAT family N-acetyltransferase n=1 Tax=Aquirhabdus sp. TaxID=2824160 RepID=UPI00396C5AE5
MHFLNQLEPNGLIQHFLDHPPQDFKVLQQERGGVPLFFAHFDLLTTLDLSLRQKISKIPFYRYWSQLLKPYTCFMGTTVSEYVPLSKTVSASDLVLQMKDQYASHFPFLIIKDIPQQSPLLTSQDNDYAASLMSACIDAKFVRIEGQALAWVKIDFDSTADYLSRLSSSRRRNIRRKLRSRQDLTVDYIQSGDRQFLDSDIIDEYYRLYLNVYEQSEIHFDLLSRDFFEAVLQDGQLNGVIFAYRKSGQLIAFNICFVENNTLVDKYIGLLYPEARHCNIYTVSWFENLQYALDHGLTRYIAGWTDPEIKAELGAQFTWTQHAVFIRNPLLRGLLYGLSSYFEGDRQWFEHHELVIAQK